MRDYVRWFVAVQLAGVLCAACILVGTAFAHFKDRPDLNSWAAGLRAAGSHAMCCSFADAESLTDPQVDTKDGHYRVFLDGAWVEVPDDAVVTVPNRYGSAVVWPLRYPNEEGGKVYGIRCFLPGAGS